MNEDVNLSAAGLNLIKHFEGLRKLIREDQYGTFECPEGALAIGFGHKETAGRKFIEGDIWSAFECERALLYDLTAISDRLRRLVLVRLTQGQFDALVSFAFNVGLENLADSDLLKKLNQKSYQGAAAEFARWNRSAGAENDLLTKRRERESTLFLFGGEEDYQTERAVTYLEGDMPQQVDKPSPEPSVDGMLKDPAEGRRIVPDSQPQQTSTPPVPPLKTEEADG